MSNSLLKDACLEGSVLKVIELMTECPDIVAFLITTHYGWFLELNENICHLLFTEASRSGQLEKLAVYFTKNVQKSLLEMACARRLLAIALLLHELDPILFPITTPALAAAIEGDRYDVFVALLSKRGYREGEGLLHQASSEAKYARYLDVLLTHGYDKDVNATHPDWDVHPLRLAVRTGSMQIVQSLLKHKAIITNQEVTSACRGFYLEITRLFLRQGPKELDMDLTALLYHAVSNQNAPMVELLLEYNATITSVIMRIACQIFPNLQVLRLLLRTGTDIRLATMNLIATQIMFDAMAEEGISFDTWSPNYSYILTRAFEFDIELSEDELISILHTQIRSCALEEKKEAMTQHFVQLVQQGLITPSICYRSFLYIVFEDQFMFANFHDVLWAVLEMGCLNDFKNAALTMKPYFIPSILRNCDDEFHEALVRYGFAEQQV